MMRLICPNCGAQYEVGEDVIPPAGRDVQCSNCAHTWFETPGASEAREAGDPAPETVPTEQSEAVPTPEAQDHSKDMPADPEPEPAPKPEPEPTPEPEAEPEPEPDPEPEATTTEEPEPQRRALDPSVTDILREEAAHEAEQRAAETGDLSSQPDLGLDRPLDRDEQLAEEARRRMARLKGEAAPAIGTATAVASGARSDLLPDIDEINSSLRSESERAEADPAAEVEAEIRKSGFRRGFMTVIILAILALILYILAPQISNAVPALEPTLSSYVDMIDRGRLWLDLQLQSILPGGDS